MTWIKDTVQELIERYDTNDPFELASFMNINVVYWDLHEEIRGFYKYDKRNKYIFINNNLDEELQFFTGAHELGHAKLHPRVNTPFLREKTFLSVDRIEVEANTFAVELLLPDQVIHNHKDECMTLDEIASMYCVPGEVVHLKSLHGFGFSPSL